MGEAIGWIIFIILLFGAPIVIMVANIYILKNIYKQVTATIINKMTTFKCCFIQHLLTWIIVIILANIINDGGFDGLSIFQSLFLLVAGIAIYTISGQFILKKILPKTEEILRSQFGWVNSLAFRR